MNDAVVVARGFIDGYETIVAAMEYGFIGGSMGVVVGEKITRGIERALATRRPMIIVSCSGGARMMEGALSLMQMAKICSALARLDQEHIPYISILTDPTTGGVTASFAMLGDLNIAEPGALIGFAGPRVIEQTIRQKLPDGFQRSEFLLEHGMLDLIVDRREMKSTIARALRFMGQHPVEAGTAGGSCRRGTLNGTGTGESWNHDPFQYLLALEKFGIKFGLANIQTLAAALGQPAHAVQDHSHRRHERQGVGDGDDRLRAARVGPEGGPLYLAASRPPRRALRHRRRRLSTQPCWSELIEEMRRLIDELLAKGSLESPPTFFEVTTAIAFEIFRRARVDVAVLEVGLGGRLDSTNIAQPIAAAITSIDFDHEQYLGNTLAAIAAEKAGVIRRDIPVVVGPVAVRGARRHRVDVRDVGR